MLEDLNSSTVKLLEGKFLNTGPPFSVKAVVRIEGKHTKIKSLLLKDLVWKRYIITQKQAEGGKV